MTVNEVRERYLNFFKARGHTVIPSAPIIPENDPTTLFTSSGMQPLVPYLLGQPHPEGARLADSQLSFRAEDIEEVGDNRHTTFFEMLGNWSLGDYFKAEQLPWFFQFLTDPAEGLGLDPHHLYVTVFGGDTDSDMVADTESVEIWERLFKEARIEAKFVEIGTEENGAEVGMQGGRIFSYGARKNWWSRAGVPAKMPVGEIGGPDSEVFYDSGLPHDKTFGEYCHPNCDCGRFIEIGNSVFIQYIKQADGSFKELPKRNVDFGGGLERLAFAQLGFPDIFLIDVFNTARELLEKRSGKKYREDEDSTRSFRVILDHTRAAAFFIASGVTPGPNEQGYVLRRLIRRSIREADKLGIKDAVLAEVASGFGAAYADVYPFIAAAAAKIKDELEREEVQFRTTYTRGLRKLEDYMRVQFGSSIGITKGEFKLDPEIKKWLPPGTVFSILTTDGFPREDIEEIAKERDLDIDWPTVDELLAEHQQKSRAGAAQKFTGGLADHAEQTIKYHTTHHLLLKALQKVLGPEVHQRGSNITSERLRMDFSYGQKMTPEQIAQAEQIVNEQIAAELPVIRTVMSREEAEKLRAEHEFGATYPEQVSVYSVGSKDASETDPKFNQAFSIEFCGGPHVANTRVLGEGGKKFKIKKVETSSAGVRRIRAILE